MEKKIPLLKEKPKPPKMEAGPNKRSSKLVTGLEKDFKDYLEKNVESTKPKNPIPEEKPKTEPVNIVAKEEPSDKLQKESDNKKNFLKKN